MNFKKLCSAILIFGFLFTSCSSDDKKEEEIITDFGGASIYFIDNQSDNDLKITLTTSEQLGLQIDSSKTIMANSRLELFTDADIGVNPAPEDSFSKIEFYESTNDSAIFTIDPIINEDWILIDQDLSDSGFGLTTYEYIITNTDLN
ncbi:MAG: hypothetical protein WA951_03640 [Leeuwenhoekiella sp.]